ncbi:hypothetical protein JCM1393_01520 [Clostridium carnis]
MAEEKNGSKSKSKILIISLALIAILGGGTFASVYFYLNKGAATAPVVIEEAFFEVGEIFVNLSDEGSKRYVKLTVSVSYNKSNKDLEKELKEKKVALRDTAIFYLKACKAKSFEPANEAVLKGDMLTRLNQKLKSGTLIDVYINDIIVQ